MRELKGQLGISSAVAKKHQVDYLMAGLIPRSRFIRRKPTGARIASKKVVRSNHVATTPARPRKGRAHAHTRHRGNYPEPPLHSHNSGGHSYHRQQSEPTAKD